MEAILVSPGSQGNFYWTDGIAPIHAGTSTVQVTAAVHVLAERLLLSLSFLCEHYS